MFYVFRHIYIIHGFAQYWDFPVQTLYRGTNHGLLLCKAYIHIIAIGKMIRR